MPAWAATVSPASCWARRRPGSPTSPRPASTTPTTTAATFRTTGAKSNFTFNYGLRIEHEDGLREKSNQFTVGFDQGLVSPLSGTAPGLAAIRGTNEILGGLMHAGVDGNNTYQGDPPGVKISPRVGMVYSLNPRSVVRAGYGMFWAPWNYQFPGTTNYGNIGYSFRTTMQENQAAAVPTTLLRNPFPNGLTSPSGNSLGVLTGVSNSIDVIDQNKGAPRVQQLSLDYQHELTDSIALSVGFAHARGDDPAWAGPTTPSSTSTRSARKWRRFTPAQLTEQVPNPFFGLRQFGGFANSATIARGQLLRPFPQFQNINLRQVTEGKRVATLILKISASLTALAVGSTTPGAISRTTSSVSPTYQFNTTGRPQDNYNIDAVRDRLARHAASSRPGAHL